MPTYDYECHNGHRFEIFQRMSDEPVSVCTECGAPAQRKISGGAGFLFKGDGFYITDYRSADYKEKASADKGDAPAKKLDTAKGTSAAPATKSDTKGGDSSAGSKGAKTSSDS
ncbi:MAG: zinc ribbon domain-containing protein [Gemmatimonadetes bacterium]|nr:zinc ribbon domain-containing protein [Gemmatimonadota bacterium]MDA1104712.1 zinc ribbon domain-containing protein [Gemmatimonadota bacterium]